MKTLILVVTLALTFGATFGATAAHADKQAEAIKNYERGEKLYADENYEEALKAFRKAYTLQPIPALFINIGQCFRQMGQHDLAITAFERYLKEDPEGEMKASVEELIAAEKAALNPPPLAPEPPPAAPEPPPPAVEPAPAAAAPAAEPAPEEGGMMSSPLTWAVVGGAALAVVAGGAVAVAFAVQPPPPAPEGSLGRFDLR